MLGLRQLDLSLPPPWVRGVLVVVFLGFGVLVGSATSSSGSAPTASVQPHLRLVLPSAAPTSAPGSAASASAPPPASAEATPEASGATEAPSASGGGGTPGGGGTSSGSGKAGSGGKGTGAGSSGSGSGGKEGAGGEGGSAGGEGASKGGSAGKLPPVKHVFLIVLADQPYAAVFGPASKAAYLSHTLERQGELLVRYYAVAHDELANGIALLSGQGPTAQTAANCPTFADVAPASAAAGGQVTGTGCVYPSSTATLTGQLAAKHLTWRAYVEGMDEAQGKPVACLHPALGAADPTAAGTYATFRNPFLYFHSVIDSPSACAAEDVGLGQLSTDLKSAKHTPSFAYIVPSLCDDANPTPCAPGKAAGMAPADALLHKVVPQILASKAYKEGGLLAITVDQAPATGVEADSSSCCGQPRFPALPAPAPLPGGGQLPPAGGGQVGMLLLSKFVKAAGVDQDPYNHFSLLRTVEDLFGLAHLGYAQGKEVGSFNAAVFNGG